VNATHDGDWQTLDDDGRAFLAEALSSVGQQPSRPDGLPLPAAPTGQLANLLDAAISADASDLHLSVDLPPHLRVRGVLRPLVGSRPMNGGELRDILHEALTAEQRSELAATGDLDCGFTVSTDRGPRRFRASIFRQSGSLAAAIRIVPSAIPTIESLGLPVVARRFVEQASGLVLVTGPTGSGKSTTLAAMTDEVNRTRVTHILTVEDPIEYRYTPARSVVQQREVGTDTESFAAALRRALRQDPDVILIGELRDLETIQIALTAAETGHLVLATLHSADATSAINRIIDVFPAGQQSQIRSQLALSVCGCICQRLLPRPDGALVPATEVMVATAAVRSLIRESKVHQLRTVLETGGDTGMHTFDQSLASLVKAGQIDLAVARGAAQSLPNLETLVGS
jgi:twitching motility protein PilT